MNAWIVAAALGLLAAWPLTVIGSIVGLLAERLTRSPRVREWAWGAVFVLPLLFLLQVLGGRFFADVFATARAAAAHTARVHSTLPLSSMAPPAAPPLFEALLARPEAVWIASAVLALSLAGAVARLAMWIAGTQRLTYVIRRAGPLEAPDLDRSLATEAARTRIAPPPVLVSEEIDRPMLAGLRRPTILIPANAVRQLDAQRLGLIGLHELAHLRRGDNLRRPLEEILLGLFWMTPPLGLVRERMAAATEEACDGQALRGAEPAVRRLYAQALVDTLRLGAGPEHAPAFIGAGRRSRLMRMNAILNPARPARPLTILALGAAGAALVVGAGFAARTAAAQAAAAQPDPAPTTKTVVMTADPTLSYDGKSVTLKVDGDIVDEAGRHLHLTDKSVKLVLNASDSSANDLKRIEVTGVVDVDGDGGKGPKMKIEGTVDPKGLTIEDATAGAVYVLTQDPKASSQTYTLKPGKGDGKKVYFLSANGAAAQTLTLTHNEPLPAVDAKPHAESRFSTSSPDQGSVDLEADRMSENKDTGLVIYSGSPTLRVVKGKKDQPFAFQLNGKPAPEGFDPSSIPAGQIDRIEVHRGVPPGETLNIVTKNPAG